MNPPLPSDSLRTPLVFVANSSASRSSPSPPHVIDIVRPCPLLDTLPPIRSMMLDYMDDRTAMHYLSTCQSLHVLYHHYPLKQAMSESAFVEATRLPAYFERIRRGGRWIPICVVLQVFIFIIVAVPVVIAMPQSQRPVAFALLIAAAVVLWCGIARCVQLRRRADCCTSGRWRIWRRRYRMPRVTKLSDALQELRLAPYLQHLTELTIRYDKLYRPFGKKYPLPHSLRTLHLLDSPGLIMDADTLPPRLTSLSLGAIKNAPLPAGVLPQSLTSLQLTSGFDVSWSIEENVLPSNLQRLELDRWTRPMSHLALPASLIELTVHYLPDRPLQPLPSQLQVLAIGGWFNQSLTGVLPSNLRVLRLTGHYDQPLTARLFASTPHLEELHLNDHSARELHTVQRLGGDILPHSLRVLRLGVRCSLELAEASEAVPRLRRVIVPAGWVAERVRRLEQLGQARGFMVVQEALF